MQIEKFLAGNLERNNFQKSNKEMRIITKWNPFYSDDETNSLKNKLKDLFSYLFSDGY